MKQDCMFVWNYCEYIYNYKKKENIKYGNYIISQVYMEKEEYTQDIIDQIICNVIGYSQANGNLLHKYNDAFYLNYFDRIKIDETVRKVTAHQKQLEISQFVRLFLSVIEHKSDETLYLAISLTKLFKKIKEETTNEKGVKFADFTSFLCNKISEGDPDLIIPMKKIAMQKIIPNTSKIRDIDVNPPPILNKAELERPKITKDKKKKDKKLDEKKPVAKFIYSQSLKSIITLGRLSSSITLYDPKDLHVQHKILPSTCRLMSKDVAILSLAFCEKDQRIGCIINNIGVTFWEASDNFCTQKILGLHKSDYDPKGCGDKIYYLNLFQQWVTTDKDTIFFWDLKEEKVTKSIKKEQSKLINDICEINHLRSLLVSYNLQQQSSKTEGKQKQTKVSEKSEEKILILYQDGKQKSKLALQNPGCHSICYNPITQLIICLGYQSNICVYQIDTKTFDINIVTELQAHSSILTCVTNLPDSAMIISGDDIGHLKLWDLNYMRCLQSIKIAKNLTQLSCSDGTLVYSDSRINTIPMQESNSTYRITNKQKDEETYGIYQFFRKQQETLWIITRKQARQISIHTGRIKNIIVLCNAEEDISAAAEIFNGFLIGTSRGQMSKFALDGERKWKVMAHQGQIHSIKVDMPNHLIVTIGGDNNLYVWSQKSMGEEQGPRKILKFGNKDIINLVEVCPYANLLLVGSLFDNTLTIWNYDNLKLAYKLEFNSTITAFHILTNKQSFIVATMDGGLSTFLYTRKEMKLKINLISVINVNDVFLQRSQNSMKAQDIDGEDYITEIPSDKRSYINKLSHCEDNNMVLGSTPKGLLYCFEPDNFIINSNYRRQYEPTSILKRPMKQSLQKQMLKSQYVSLRVRDMEIFNKQSQMLTLWYNQIHKDSIYFLNIINLQKKYACTLCVDGYFKLTQLVEEDGIIVCSHKINFPLPVKWDIDVRNYCDLKNQIHEAIAVVDSIIKNFSYELTIKEQSSLNVTQFMQKMISGYFQVQKPERCANIMNQEFSHADVKQIAQKTISLKSLQAYKRLQLIKKNNELSNPQKSPQEVSYHYETSPAEKQSIRNFLQPNYLPKLLNKHTIQQPDTKKGKSNDLVSRLEDALNQQELKKIAQKQNKMAISLTKSQLKQQHQQNSYRKNTSMRSQNHSIVREKTVKEILSQINSKLYLHKRSKNKVLEAFSYFQNS